MQTTGVRWTATAVVVGYLTLSYGWIVGTGWMVEPVAAATGWPSASVEVGKGLLFVTLTAVLLGGSLTWWSRRAAASERRWAELAASTREGLFVVELGEHAHRLVYANGAFERIVGRPVADFQADPTLPFQLVAPEDLAAFRAAWMAPAAQQWPLPLRLVLPDRSSRFVELSGSVGLRPRGSAVFQGIVVDLTAREERERALEAAVTAQQRAAAELAQTVAVKDGLLTAMSHELRTPLTVVAGWAQTLQARRGQLSRAQQLHAENAIVEQARRLTVLVDDLVQLDQAERAGVPVTVGFCDAGQIVAAAVAASPVVSRTTVDVPHELPVLADREQVRRIVEELLRNVAKYAPEGPVTVTVAGSGDGRWTLQVTDSGPGLPAGTEQEVLQPFVRYDHSYHSPGAGLGLALIVRYVEAHGGRIELGSRPDGLTVAVSMPVDPPVQRPQLRAV